MKFTFAFLLLSLCAHGQTPAPSVPNAWDIAPVIQDFSEKAQRLKPLLYELKPQEWIAKGAPDTYLSQLTTAQQELDYLMKSAKLFADQPEKLTLAFDAFSRWDSLHARLQTLRDGARRYQDANIGDLLEAVFSVNAENHDKLRQYISDLASQKEEEFAVVDREAQRCRGALTRQPPPKTQGKE